MITPAAAQATKPEVMDLGVLEKEFEHARRDYLNKLEKYLPQAYEQRFIALTDEQLTEIARTRRLWQYYTVNTTKTNNFQKNFLDPIDAVADMLLIKPQHIDDEAVAGARANAFEAGQRLRDARRQSGVEIDPTKEMKSPTGLAYPPLDQPQTCVDILRLYERTMVLARTVAPPDARPVLIENAKRCALIDFEEAAFVMYGNQVRMLIGTVAWVADPLTTACARDHSVDRKNGKASGHTSTVPGKEGFGDRLRLWGAKGSSEGAGGGTGESYIRGLSYGGGHTGPLYSIKRNAVGPGRADRAFTSVYYTDKSMYHKSQATEGELFLPPGVERSDLRSRLLRSAYTGFYKEQFNKVYDVLAGEEPGEGFDGAIHRYLTARLDAEVQWTITGIQRIAAAGDVAEASTRFQRAQKTMQGIPAFEAEVESLQALFSDESVGESVKAGKIFRRICAEDYTAENMKKLIEMFPDTVYAKAAKKCIDDGMPKKAAGPLTFFTDRDQDLNQWGYVINY
ncbi:MAG: hypothetical protein AAGB26_10965 [Planctomycetota bacterium]